MQEFAGEEVLIFTLSGDEVAVKGKEAEPSLKQQQQKTPSKSEC